MASKGRENRFQPILPSSSGPAVFNSCSEPEGVGPLEATGWGVASLPMVEWQLSFFFGWWDHVGPEQAGSLNRLPWMRDSSSGTVLKGRQSCAMIQNGQPRPGVRVHEAQIPYASKAYASKGQCQKIGVVNAKNRGWTTPI